MKATLPRITADDFKADTYRDLDGDLRANINKVSTAAIRRATAAALAQRGRCLLHADYYGEKSMRTFANRSDLAAKTVDFISFAVRGVIARAASRAFSGAKVSGIHSESVSDRRIKSACKFLAEKGLVREIVDGRTRRYVWIPAALQVRERKIREEIEARQRRIDAEKARIEQASNVRASVAADLSAEAGVTVTATNRDGVVELSVEDLRALIARANSAAPAPTRVEMVDSFGF